MRSRPRGLRLASKLLLMSLVLLGIPWLGYQYLLEMKRFLFEGQAQAQLLTAQGVATLLHGSDELAEDLPPSLDDYQRLASYPLKTPIRLDGYRDDWQDFGRMAQSFGRYYPAGPAVETHRFRLALGTRSDFLYAYLEVNDSSPIFRHPSYLRLDNGDHLRMSFMDNEGGLQRLLISIEGPGNASAYYVDENWRYAYRGQPDYRIQSVVQQSGKGYNLELRIPLTMLAKRKQLGLAVADVENEKTRQVASVAGTFPQLDADQLSLVVLRSPAVENLLLGIENRNARIWILDRHKRVRAIAGRLSQERQTPPSPLENRDIPLWHAFWYSFVEFLFNSLIEPSAAAFDDFDPVLTQERDDSILLDALAGTPNTQYRRSLDGRAQIISASYPIRDGEEVIGAVLLEQSASSILSLQRASLEQVVSVTLGSFLLIFVVLLAFGVRLTWRIRRLRTEAGQAIDQYGRLLVDQVEREASAADEIGDLSRGFSGILKKLHSYQGFIAQMPQTLRHEINNPLNTISTSLEHLGQEPDSEQRLVYLDGAQRGLRQISAIMNHLAESASLEQALQSEVLEQLDLKQLLDQYLNNFQRNHHHIPIEAQLPNQPVWIDAANFRIEQLLDKLMQNALDFSEPGEPIRVVLKQSKTRCSLSIANVGPTIPEEELPLIFNPFMSSRSGPGADAQGPTTHFGLGLYIVRLIVECHGGQVSARNLAQGAGVTIDVEFPVV